MLNEAVYVAMMEKMEAFIGNIYTVVIWPAIIKMCCCFIVIVFAGVTSKCKRIVSVSLLSTVCVAACQSVK